MRKLLCLPSALLLLLTACAETPAVKKEAEKPLEPSTGQSALYKMYQVARSWGGLDTQVLKATSRHITEVDAKPGSAGAWEAVFVMPSKNLSRSYTYSIVEQLPSLHKGVFAGPESGFSATGVNKPFPIIAVKIDTDAAYQTALKNGGEEYDKKNPGKTITVMLEKISKYPDPVWRVIWGESAGTSNFSVYVDASTGAFQEKLH